MVWARNSKGFPLHGSQTMPVLYGSVATLAVASIYYVWKVYIQARLQRERMLRERVAYMLWVLAHDAE